ncbi:MAG: DUF3145 family protein [Leucobacter sp.]
MASETTSVFTTGVLFVHSCPKAIAPHVEWALAHEVGQVVTLDWAPQPLLQENVRTTAHWRGPVGTAAAVASALFGWKQLRFEITEEATPGEDGGRWMHTPSLGIFRMQTDSAGNGVLTENAVRAAIAGSEGDAVELGRELKLALGDEWDAELEPFRMAEDGDAVVTPLHRVG